MSNTTPPMRVVATNELVRARRPREGARIPSPPLPSHSLCRDSADKRARMDNPLLRSASRLSSWAPLTLPTDPARARVCPAPTTLRRAGASEATPAPTTTAISPPRRPSRMLKTDSCAPPLRPPPPPFLPSSQAPRGRRARDDNLPVRHLPLFPFLPLASHLP